MSKSLKPYCYIFLAAMVAFGASIVLADGYPKKPVTEIVPFPAGGSTDLMGRSIAVEFTDYLGKNVVVTNTGGGAGTVGLAALARSRPDGYTIGVVPAAPLVNQPHMRKTPYDIDSFQYICELFYSPMALAVKPGSPFKDLKQLVDYVKAHPDELTYGSPGPGTLPHLAMEQFLDTHNLKIKHVPFTGDGPGATALLGGHIDMYLAIISVVADKELNALAVFNDKRVESLPNLPTAKEAGYDAESSWWGGVIAPKGIPEEALTKLNGACMAAAKSPRLNDTLKKLGSFVQYRDPKEFKAYVEKISEQNGKLIKKLLKPGKTD